jgi:hypothetical protein
MKSNHFIKQYSAANEWTWLNWSDKEFIFMKFVKSVSFGLMVAMSLSSIAQARPSLNCRTLGSGETTYELVVDDPFVALNGVSSGLLSKFIKGVHVEARPVVIRSLPIKSANFVFTTPGLVATIADKFDGKRSTEGSFRFTTDDDSAEDIPVFCYLYDIH